MNPTDLLIERWQGPAWLLFLIVSVLWAIKVVYNDVFRDYLITRTKIMQEHQRNMLESRNALDIIEGQYHLFARHIITMSLQIADNSNINNDKDLVLEYLRIAASDVYNKTLRNLNHYKYAHTNIRLSKHLGSLRDADKIDFYMPIVEKICNTKNASNQWQIRSIILQQIDTYIMLAAEAVFQSNDYKDDNSIA